MIQLSTNHVMVKKLIENLYKRTHQVTLDEVFEIDLKKLSPERMVDLKAYCKSLLKEPLFAYLVSSRANQIKEHSATKAVDWHEVEICRYCILELQMLLKDIKLLAQDEKQTKEFNPHDL